MVCKIADFIVDFKNVSAKAERFLKKYKYDDTPQFTIEITPEEIENAYTLTNTPQTPLQAEFTAIYTKLISTIPLYNALFFHASLIEVHGVGVAFTALSGTGKSTHTKLWKQLLAENVEVINGDKPIIRFIDDIPYGYGTPWCGKENWGKNAKTPIKHICFIERSTENFCQKITPQDALKNIFNQIFIPKEPTAAFNTLNLLDNLLKNVNVWVIKCNTDISAAKIAYNTIFGEIK